MEHFSPDWLAGWTDEQVAHTLAGKVRRLAMVNEEVVLLLEQAAELTAEQARRQQAHRLSIAPESGAYENWLVDDRK